MNRFERLDRLPFELSYLALLTRYRLKPLSRWEEALSPRQIDILSSLGLEVAEIDRMTLLNRRLPRVVFSVSGHYVDEFRRRFSGKRLKHSPRATRVEGWFFGYPSCCVEQFTRKPYVPNGLSRDDQRILFHWACPDCNATRSVLHGYRSIYNECLRIHGGVVSGDVLSKRFPGLRDRGSQFRKAFPWAASLAALALVPGLSGALDGDPHCLPAPDDSDNDGLSFAEELILGRSVDMVDSDANGIHDGIDESLALSSMIANLPREPRSDVPYAIECPMYGQEQCSVCGEWINMGFIQIIHPVRDLEVTVHYIGLHYLEHGSLGYDGSINSGRVDVDFLKRILFPEDPLHLIPAAMTDSDSDQLEDVEEPLLSTDPSEPDTDFDSLGDGAQVAEELIAALSVLPREPRDNGPYLIEHPLRGFETCDICGEQMNMGSVEIVNPLEDITLCLPYIALHCLAHGSFGYSGEVHLFGRTLPTVLDVVLRGDGGAHRLSIENDDDSDGLMNQEELALGLNPVVPDSDGDGIYDGPELAFNLHRAVAELPVGPLPDQKYVIHIGMDGVYQCLICGESIDMGFMEIVDPVAGKSTTLNYYNDHFMAHGSFSTDRPGLYPRQDIPELVDILGITVTGNGNTLPSAAVLA
ncbi:MAG: hypothetical protein KAX38_05205, partial [Candidatus Krumholzibacteria bacterium]|nr:hypothetical protein [Candidatus Krumholzibacteria bacterium]